MGDGTTHESDPVNYILQVLVGRESEYKQVRTSLCSMYVACQSGWLLASACCCEELHFLKIDRRN